MLFSLFPSPWDWVLRCDLQCNHKAPIRASIGISNDQGTTTIGTLPRVRSPCVFC